MYTQSKRNYTDIETNETFAMFHNAVTGQNKLVNLKTGEEIINFYCAGHSYIKLRLKNKKEIELSIGDFIRINEENPPTHVKYLWFKRFVKI